MAKQTEETPKTTTVKKTKTRKGWRFAKKALVVVLILALAGLAGYFYKQYNDLKKDPVSSQEAQEQENKRIIEAVGKLYTLPQDETPVIFFVSDKDKLSDDYKKQEFFQKAVNGDYILIYEKAKIALLYRPSENRLVDVRPYSVQSTLLLALLGPEANRAATEKVLKDAFKDEVTVKTKTDSKTGLTGVVVVDLSGKYSEQAAKIAEKAGGSVSKTLPAGETAPDGVDMVVFVGNPATAPAPAPTQ